MLSLSTVTGTTNPSVANHRSSTKPQENIQQSDKHLLDTRQLLRDKILRHILKNQTQTHLCGRIKMVVGQPTHNIGLNNSTLLFSARQRVVEFLAKSLTADHPCCNK